MKIPSKYQDAINELLNRLSIIDGEEKEEKKEEKKQADEDTEEEYEEEETTALYEVSKVNDHRVDEKGEFEFLVSWRGYRERTWIRDEDCFCESLISKYLKAKGINTLYAICRVSTKNQADDEYNISYETQKHQILVTIERHRRQGRPIPPRIKTINICCSAYKKVPHEIQTLPSITSAGDMVYAYQVDRLSRNIEYIDVFRQLDAQGVKIYVTDQDLFFHERKTDFYQYVLNGMNQSNTLSRKIKASVEMRKIRGDDLGQAKYGFRAVRDEETKRRTFEVDEREQAVIRRVKKMVRERHPFRDIADTLNRERIYKRGKRWTASMVRYVSL